MIPTTQHVSFMANGIKVFFPFQPYDTQRDYIESVIRALNFRQNALLESPTGTGKTLSLLCSTLAWLQSRTGEHPMIYYTSRTHIQLGQAAKEMKRSAYARVPGVVIGSRAQLCLNDEVRQQPGDNLINRACRNAITKNACAYHTNYEQKLESLDVDGVNDIEDLCRFGKQHQCCPYYSSKKIAESKASIVFMPYNYLLDTSLKKSTQLKLENSIIIFDEAHNIEGVLKDAASGSFTQHCLSTIQDSCLRLPHKLSEVLIQEKHGLSRLGYNPAEKRVAVVDEFKSSSSKTKEKEPKPNPIEELAENLTIERLQQVNLFVESLKGDIRSFMDLNKTYSTDRLFDALDKAGVRFTTSNNIITTLDSMSSFWSIAGVQSPTLVAKFVGACGNLSRVISLLYPDSCLSAQSQSNHSLKLKKYYTIYLEGHYDQNTIMKNSKLLGWTLHLWCLYPAIGLQRVINSSTINGPRSIIVTSGTLTPMPPIARSLGVKFEIMKAFKHVIGPKQLKIMIIGQSPNSYSLESHYEATQQLRYPDELGKTLRPLLQTLPFGSLVFFPSYSLMNRITKFWKEKTTIWNDMNRSSSMHIEGKEQESFMKDVRAYISKIDSKNRAAFIGVCRGKLSEGVNLEGNYCRTVIMIGLPFPSSTDPRVVATRSFHDKQDGERGGQLWYSQQMTRALNQTIGRVIRSKDDFGTLILCDPRFTKYKHCLSDWTQSYFPAEYSDPKDALLELSNFFESHGMEISCHQNTSSNMGAFEFEPAVKKHKKVHPRPLSGSQSQAPTQRNPSEKRQVSVDEYGNYTSLGAYMSQGISRKKKLMENTRRSSTSPSTSGNRSVKPHVGTLFRKLQSKLRN